MFEANRRTIPFGLRATIHGPADPAIVKDWRDKLAAIKGNITTGSMASMVAKELPVECLLQYPVDISEIEIESSLELIPEMSH